MKRVRFFALSGSLRGASYNSAALRTLKAYAPAHIDIEIGDIADLPLFNPDIDLDTVDALNNIKAELRKSAGLIISSPEYAHGITGAMKNALDWLVSSAEFPDIKIMLINTSARATHNILALKEVLTTMYAHLCLVAT